MRSLFLFATPLLVLTCPSVAQQKEHLERGVDVYAQALLDARQTPALAEALDEQLAQGGKSAIEPLFEILLRGRFDVRIGERGNSHRTLTPGERKSLVAAFGSLEWSAVRAHLDQLLEEGPSEGERLISLELLGAHGSAQEFPAMLVWSDPPAGERRVARGVRGAFGAALSDLLDGDPSALRGVPGLYRGAHLSLVPAIVRAVGAHPSQDGLDVLVTVLGHAPEADALVLAEIGYIGGALRYPAGDDTSEAVRDYLYNHDGTRLLEAIVALGQLEDLRSVPDLISLLEHETPAVRERAHVSLRKISGGQTMRADAELWRNWNAESREWWRSEAPEQLRRIADSTPGVATRGLLDLSKRRLFRHELAEPVAQALRRPEQELVVLACATLGHLGSTRAVPKLLALLTDESVDVRRAAYLALRRLTGEDHGDDADAWAAAGW